MKRKLLSIVLALTMALGMLPAAALAETTESCLGNESCAHQAAIGSTHYGTLAEAVSTANDGDTVKLLADAELTETLNINKAITLDGANHKITGKPSSGKTSFITVKTDGNFTMKNATILPTEKVEANAAIDLQVKGKVIIDKCVFGEADDTKQFMYNGLEFSQSEDYPMADGTTISNCTFYGGSFRHNFISFYRITEGATIDIKGNEFLNANWDTTNAIRVSNYGSANATINLIDDTYSDSGSNGNKDYAGLLFFQELPDYNDNFTKLTVNIKNLDTIGAQSDQLFYVYKNSIISTNQPVVKGDSSIEKFFVAKVGETYYTTLAEAINAAGNGDTVTLLKDAELTSTLDLAENITIDGQGKYTIKAANSFAVGSDNKTYCVLYVSGEVTLKDVTVNGNEKCRVIFCDKGKLTIDGATITNGKAPNFIGGVYMTSSASFEMKSGSITGNKNAERYQNDKYLQYSSDLWIGANANGALTAINGGTIGNVFVNANAWSANNPGSFTMNGGTVTNLYVEHDANYGATFKYNDGTIEHLYLSKENGNGQSIEVTPVKGVIYKGGVKEEDLVTLTMKYNDGATADITYNVASGTTITLPTPKRSGYTFNGWYDGSTKVSNPYTASADVTLTASWSYISSSSRYNVTAPKADHGTVTVTPSRASKGDTVTVTVTPDSGYVLETITVTDKDGKELELTDKGDGKYTFTMPRGEVTVKAAFMEDNSVLNFFYDVPNDAYYYEAVKWAVEKGITSGIGNDLFGSNDPCTRAQIVTFLWRAAGSPEPKALSSFTDVPADTWYAKAVAWAVENGVTAGVGDGLFGSDDTCTRAQSVTFLFKALKAVAKGQADFKDVASSDWFAQAVAWAVENGVTAGVGDNLFGSGDPCSRAQIVTFLFKAYQGK